MQLLIIQSKAEEAGISVAEYVRSCALGRVIAPALTEEETQAYLLLRKYGTYFAKISNLVKDKSPYLFQSIGELIQIFKEELKRIRYGKQSNSN